MSELKLKKGLVKQVEEKHEERRHQEELRKKHNLDVPDDVVVVEKSNTVKFLIRFLEAAIRIIFSVVGIILMALGIIALIYPDIRVHLIYTLQNIGAETMSMLN